MTTTKNEKRGKKISFTKYKSWIEKTSETETSKEKSQSVIYLGRDPRGNGRPTVEEVSGTEETYC